MKWPLMLLGVFFISPNILVRLHDRADSEPLSANAEIVKRSAEFRMKMLVVAGVVLVVAGLIGW